MLYLHSYTYLELINAFKCNRLPSGKRKIRGGYITRNIFTTIPNLIKWTDIMT